MPRAEVLVADGAVWTGDTVYDTTTNECVPRTVLEDKKRGGGLVKLATVDGASYVLRNRSDLSVGLRSAINTRIKSMQRAKRIHEENVKRAAGWIVDLAERLDRLKAAGPEAGRPTLAARAEVEAGLDEALREG